MASQRSTLLMLAAGVVLTCVGLVLAAFSNPGRFSLDPAADRQILLFTFSGFVCTVVGVGLLVEAARSTTLFMPPEKKRKANIGVGAGIVLQLAGLYLSGDGEVRALLGLLLVLISVPVLIWGCMHYAEGKGRSKWNGILGLAGILGLIVLIVLPDQHEEAI